MIELNEHQQQALDTSREGPLQVVDPRTKRMYVLLPAEVYEQVKDFLEDDEFDGIDVGALIADAMREDDENDPHLECYQRSEGLA